MFLQTKVSGTKEYAVLTTKDPCLLVKMARRLGESIHGKGGQEQHLDLKGHKIDVARRWGAEDK